MGICNNVSAQGREARKSVFNFLPGEENRKSDGEIHCWRIKSSLEQWQRLAPQRSLNPRRKIIVLWNPRAFVECKRWHSTWFPIRAKAARIVAPTHKHGWRRDFCQTRWPQLDRMSHLTLMLFFRMKIGWELAESGWMKDGGAGFGLFVNKWPFMGFGVFLTNGQHCINYIWLTIVSIYFKYVNCIIFYILILLSCSVRVNSSEGEVQSSLDFVTFSGEIKKVTKSREWQNRGPA